MPSGHKADPVASSRFELSSRPRIHFDAEISGRAFDFGVAEQRLYGSSQGNDLQTTGPEVGYLVIFAACYFDFAAGYFVRWPASKSASAMTNYRGD